jgi:hypothetical protein
MRDDGDGDSEGAEDGDGAGARRGPGGGRGPDRQSRQGPPNARHGPVVQAQPAALLVDADALHRVRIGHGRRGRRRRVPECVVQQAPGDSPQVRESQTSEYSHRT